MRAPFELDVHVPVLAQYGTCGHACLCPVFLDSGRISGWVVNQTPSQGVCRFEVCSGFSSCKVLCVHCSGFVAAQQQLMGGHQPCVLAVTVCRHGSWCPILMQNTTAAATGLTSASSSSLIILPGWLVSLPGFATSCLVIVSLFGAVGQGWGGGLVCDGVPHLRCISCWGQCTVRQWADTPCVTLT
jgi:hypothetical protein